MKITRSLKYLFRTKRILGYKTKFSNTLSQACTTYGPRAKCGPQKFLIWPVQPQILFILLVTLIKSLFECVKTINFGPWIYFLKKLGPPWNLSCAPLLYRIYIGFNFQSPKSKVKINSYKGLLLGQIIHSRWFFFRPDFNVYVSLGKTNELKWWHVNSRPFSHFAPISTWHSVQMHY